MKFAPRTLDVQTEGKHNVEYASRNGSTLCAKTADVEVCTQNLLPLPGNKTTALQAVASCHFHILVLDGYYIFMNICQGNDCTEVAILARKSLLERTMSSSGM
jgi:hypothetical protein